MFCKLFVKWIYNYNNYWYDLTNKNYCYNLVQRSCYNEIVEKIIINSYDIMHYFFPHQLHYYPSL